MPASDAERHNLFERLADRLREAVETKRDQRARDAERQQQRYQSRQAEIERFVQTYPPPDTLRPIERGEWTNEVRGVAEQAIPEEPDRAAVLSDADAEWIGDPTGAIFSARRAKLVAALCEQHEDAIQHQKELADQLVRLRTPSPRGWGTYPRDWGTYPPREQAKDPVIRPEIARAFTDEGLDRLSIDGMQQRVNEAGERVRELEREVHSARTVGPNGFGALRVPMLTGRSGSGGTTYSPPRTPESPSQKSTHLDDSTSLEHGSPVDLRIGGENPAALDPVVQAEAEELRADLASANQKLRAQTKHGRLATVSALARQTDGTRGHLYARQKKLKGRGIDVDFRPYLLLEGPLPPGSEPPANS